MSFLEHLMPAPQSHPADQIERLAGKLHSLAFDMREPSRSLERVERIIGDAERIATEVRAVVRGRG